MSDLVDYVTSIVSENQKVLVLEDREYHISLIVTNDTFPINVRIDIAYSEKYHVTSTKYLDKELIQNGRLDYLTFMLQSKSRLCKGVKTAHKYIKEQLIVQKIEYNEIVNSINASIQLWKDTILTEGQIAQLYLTLSRKYKFVMSFFDRVEQEISNKDVSIWDMFCILSKEVNIRSWKQFKKLKRLHDLFLVFQTL